MGVILYERHKLFFSNFVVRTRILIIMTNTLKTHIPISETSTMAIAETKSYCLKICIGEFCLIE